MTIKVKGPSGVPVAASAGQITEIQTDLGIVTTAQAQALINANTSLGALANAVQVLIDAKFAQAVQRINHTGTDPATNVLFSVDNATLESWRTSVESRLATAGTSDPVVTTDPSLGGTVGVGNVLTITRGAVTNGSGGAHQDVLTWFYLSSPTATPQQLFTETIASAATPTTYTQTVAQIGGTIYVTQQAQDTTTGRLSNTRTSNTKGPVTGTAPTNTGAAPSISGSAPSGSALSVSVGGWTGAATYVVQLYADGVPYLTASPKSATTPVVGLWISDNTVVGKVITARVTAYSSLDVPSATAVITSNSITVTGTPVGVTNVTPVAWPATINFGTAATLTAGTYSAAVNAARTYEFYIGTPDATPDFGPQANPIHTPRAPAAVGNTLYCIERVFDVATGLTEVANSVSAGKVISAALASFAAALTAEGTTGYSSWVQSSAISQANPGTLSGGTQPYILDPVTPYSPALPAGLTGSISGSNFIITGTPSAVSSSTAYTVNFKDSAGSPASASITFNASVASPSATPLRLLLPFSVDVNGTPNTWVLGNSDLNGPDGQVRWGSRSDPGGSGTQVYLAVVKLGDTQLPSGGLRAESVMRFDPNNSSNATPDSNSFMWRDYDNWSATAHWMPATSGSSGWPSPTSTTAGVDRQLIYQIHSNDDFSPPFGMDFRGVDGLLYYTTMTYNSGTGGNDVDMPGGGYNMPRGTWVKHIIHYRRSLTSPIIEVWRGVGSGSGVSYTRVVNYTTLFGNSLAPITDDYPKATIYKYSNVSSTAFGSFTTRPIYFKGIYKGVGTNLFNEAAAALSVL